MKNVEIKNFVKKSLYSNQILGAVLIFTYCMVYGLTAQIVLTGMQYMFFISSLVFAASIYYIKEPEIRKTKIKKGIFYNQLAGTLLVFAYLLVYGITSLTLLSGFQLIFFMSSYIFAMSIFYMRDEEKIKEKENISTSITSSPFQERHPCFINSQDLSWLVRELNSPLSSIIGFTELMLAREYSDREKEFMLRNIYDHALSISMSVNKVSCMITDTPTKPKEIHEVVDLLDDKNFK